MKKRTLICVIALILIVLIIVISILLLNSNVEKTLNCKSLSNNMEVTFKGNKPIFVRGKIDVSGIKNIEKTKESISMYNDVVHLDENKKEIKYALNYNELNSNVLSYIGLNYDKKLTYKDIKKILKNDNYYCK